MAQYYQVLSQEEKPEEVPSFYQNLEEAPTVQYVITSDAASQQFQTQPVVLSSNQVMVVDQSQVSYQPSSYIVQGTAGTNGINFDNTPQQQVYYMANAPTSQQIVVERSLNQAPVVLNHQLMQNQISTQQINKVNIGAPIHSGAPLHSSPLQRGQLKTSSPSIPTRVVTITTQPQKVPTRGLSQEIVTTFPTNNSAIQKKEDEVSSLGSYSQFRKAMQMEKLALQNKSSPIANMQQRKPVGGGVGGGKNCPNRNQPRPRQPRGGRANSFLTNSSIDEALKKIQQPQINEQQRPPIQDDRNQYLIQPQRPQDGKQVAGRALPHLLQSAQIENIIANTPIGDEYSDSIRMLVLLESGEQRLITFTLPKEPCTIQEILEQVNVPFTTDTAIRLSEANSNGLNYVVAVGNVPGFSTELQASQEMQTPDSTFYISQNSADSLSTSQTISNETQAALNELEKPLSPESDSDSLKEHSEPPKLVPGKLAICSVCGYLSEDFNKCMRCRRKFTGPIKTMSAPSPGNKKIDNQILHLEPKKTSPGKNSGVPRLNLLPKKRVAKPKVMECETVVVSSDEEEEPDKGNLATKKNVSLLEKLGASVTISPISKEPSNLDIQKAEISANTKERVIIPIDDVVSTLILCRTVRIGSYRFVPAEPVRIDSNSITIKVPHPKLDNTIKIIRVDCHDMVKVLISFQKSLPVIFYYLLPSVGTSVRASLDLTLGGDYYFDPLSESDEAYRRITLLPENVTDDSKLTLQAIYAGRMLFEELTYKEANDILIKTCPKELTKSVLNYSVSEIKPILAYPPEGRGRITINTEDYMCLGSDQFLNDVIIDFYIKYLILNLPKEQQEKVHAFSTFFYKRLTTKLKASRKSQPAELDPNLTAAEKRHCRVKTWTKSVNIFEKDFIIVPINENCHWFLAIICYPNMNGTHTLDGKPIIIETKSKKKKATSATKDKKLETQAIMCEDPDLSDKDEAEGDDSELDSDDSEELPPTPLSVENNSSRPPIRQPCILIFDSLAGASRSRVVATLRDYLTCEYKAKLETEKIFTKDVIKGACPKVPQQTNFTDCGLYLLQYVEHFFKEPIKDYYIPILHLKTWFDEIIVTRKREDISQLIQSLMKEGGKDLNILPDVIFPTLNGELTERTLLENDNRFIDPDEDEEMMDEEEDDDEDEDYLPEKQHKKIIEKKCKDVISSSGDNGNSLDIVASSVKEESTLLKPSNESVTGCGEDFIEQTVINNAILKPDISELPKLQSNKDTLSYLKAKRIMRHKNNISEGSPENKKQKKNDDP